MSHQERERKSTFNIGDLEQSQSPIHYHGYIRRTGSDGEGIITDVVRLFPLKGKGVKVEALRKEIKKLQSKSTQIPPESYEAGFMYPGDRLQYIDTTEVYNHGDAHVSANSSLAGRWADAERRKKLIEQQTAGWDKKKAGRTKPMITPLMKYVFGEKDPMEELKRLYVTQHMTETAIANTYRTPAGHLSQKSIHDWLIRFKIPLRGRSNAATEARARETPDSQRIQAIHKANSRRIYTKKREQMDKRMKQVFGDDPLKELNALRLKFGSYANIARELSNQVPPETLRRWHRKLEKKF